ncbi:MAG TPA: methylated-DNA--[protein]-cysteine S-methyltransferase [Rhizomicrobium sp.]|jgi:methylated-DNA-[protein]-cysteine S-methyltransferase|nr:methylated-DNA--[protein]-cysteine S-methyltransferase [Rhizomicrobium sp.]
MDRTEQRYAIFETAQGHCAIAWSAKGVTRFRLPQSSAKAAERGLRRALPQAMPGNPPPGIALAIEGAKRYFAGERVDFSGVPVDLGRQTELFEKIYDAARRLGWGETATYGALAKQFGDDWEIARDVGQAMAKNPVPLIVPCHRVLAAGGKIGGFSAPGGAATKARMLELEGVRVAADDPAQPSLPI